MKNEKSEQSNVRHVEHWGILKFVKGDATLYRLLSTTSDDFFDRWRLNSGIINFMIYGEYVDFHGYSGSIYRCSLSGEGFTAFMNDILVELDIRFPQTDYLIHEIKFDQFIQEWKAYKTRWN